MASIYVTYCAQGGLQILLYLTYVLNGPGLAEQVRERSFSSASTIYPRTCRHTRLRHRLRNHLRKKD